MAINVNHAASPLLVGPAANLAGQGELARYQQQQALREQEMAMRQQAMDQQSQQNDARLQLQQQAMGLQAYQFDVGQRNQFYNAQQARQAQLAAQAMQQRGRFGEMQMRGQLQQQGMWGDLAQQQMANDARMELELMNQQGLGQRQENTVKAQLESQMMAAKMRQAASDAMMLQKATLSGELDQEQVAEAWAQYEQRYADMDMGLPVQVPSDTQAEDPFAAESVVAAIHKAAQEKGEVSDAYLTPEGDVMYPRGKPQEAFPEYREFHREQNAAELQVTQQKEAVVAQQKLRENRVKYAEAMAEARERAESMFVREIPAMDNGAGGKTAPKIERDQESYDKYMREHHLFNRGAFQEPPGKLSDGTPIPPVPLEMQDATWVINQQEFDALPPGTKIAFFNGQQWDSVIKGYDDAKAAKAPAAPAAPPAMPTTPVQPPPVASSPGSQSFSPFGFQSLFFTP